MQDQKFICNNCGFDSPEGAGYCPMCDVGYMVKVCECGSGNYAHECCEFDPEMEKKQEEMKKELAKETAEEIKVIAKEEIKEEEEEDQLFKEAQEEAPKVD